MHSVRILIADDHEIVRQGMRSLFSLRSNWDVCGEAVDGRDAIEKAKQLQPDVVLLDISMPLLNGLEAARVIRKEVPHSQILIVSQHEAAHMRTTALEAGARGYVAKSELSRELLAAVEAVLDPSPAEPVPQNGSNPVSPAAAGGQQRKAVVPPSECLIGGGEMGALMRSMDWSATRLGPVENWPQSLKTSVSTCLNSRFPILIWWGPDLIMLYNDGYRQIIGSKHPAALGHPGKDCWWEIWTTIGPMLDAVLNRGESTWSDDLLLLLERHGYLEECYFTFSYSPIRDESGGIGGVFTPVNETTKRVISERRMRTLHSLASRALTAGNEDEAWRLAAESLNDNLFDIPFSIMLRTGSPQGQLEVVGSSGIPPDHSLCRLLSGPASPLQQQTSQAIQSGSIVEVDNLERLGPDLPCGAWNLAPRQALLLPIAPASQDRSPGVLFAAVSPRKQLDHTYRAFLELIAHQISSSLADARTSDSERGQAEVRSRLAAIVEFSEDAIVSKNLSGVITSWNKGAESIFGYSAEEAVGQHITLIIPKHLREEENEILRRLRLGERIEHFETVRVTKAGKRVNVSLSVSPVRDASGKIVGASKIARDITERKDAERALKNAHEELEARVRERTRELQRAQDDLRALSNRLLQMQDEERRRIARELHDSAGQVLAALNMNLIPLEEQLKALDPGMARTVSESIGLVNELSGDLRTISHLLHPPLLDEAGLSSALQWFVEGFAERSRIPVKLELDPGLGRLTAEMETVIFRVVQESLTNIHRHSGSATATIRILREEEHIRLEVRDLGKGIAATSLTSATPGVGIQGMRERVRQLGGTFTIQSDNTGTVVTAVLPEVKCCVQQAG
jgi:PAS domain S-box-containing protein